jgi:DNA-binding transcriptional LysR family regulator
MSELLNWDEFRIVRAIAETRSLSGAAERLGLNHSTMFRRLCAVESRLGVRLFERDRGGYRPTAFGEDMTALAVLMGETIAEFERRVTHNDLQVSGLLRVTTIHSLGLLELGTAAAALRAAHPGLHLEILLTEASLDLHRGEADLALRCRKGPPAANFSGRRIAALPWGIFALPALLDEAGQLRADAPWITPSENFMPAPARRWLDRHVEPHRRALRANNDLLMAELAAQGAGAALLPVYAAARHPGLVNVGRADPELDSELWLLASAHALGVPRIRVAFDFLVEALTGRRAWIEGEPPVANRQGPQPSCGLARNPFEGAT